MSTCRIGQNERCCKTGCEFSKVFGTHCHSDGVKLIGYSSDDYWTAIENQSKNQKEIHKFSYVSSHENFYGGKKNKKRKNKPKNNENKRRRVYDRSSGICYLCGEKVEYDKFTIDHVIPISRGGGNDISNLRATHEICNAKKGNKIIKFPINK